MRESLSKKPKKVIEKGLEELKQRSSLAELTRIGARMMLEVAIEEELTAFLGRDYYERLGRGKKGYGSGSKPMTIKIGCGDIEVEMPRVRDAGGPFHSEILPPRVTRMDEIQHVIPLLYMNGLSSRKVKKSVARHLGKRGLSHQNVIRITEKIVEEFNLWKRRDLSGLRIIYLIFDGIRLGVRAGTREKEAVLVAWAFLEDGSRELLSVSLGNQESYNAWKGFLEDMIKRGLTEPMLRVTDVLNKVLKEDRAKVKDSLRKIFYASTYEHAKEAIEMFKRDWGKKYPSAVDFLMDDIELCLTYYKYPYRHWSGIGACTGFFRSGLGPPAPGDSPMRELCLRIEKSAKINARGSGRVQKNGAFFWASYMTLREETELVETVEAGWNTLVGYDPERVVEAVQNSRTVRKDEMSFGDGWTAERIVSTLERGGGRYGI